MDHCDECGYQYASTPRQDIAPTFRALAQTYSERLMEGGDDALRSRPQPQTWSALEYACHVRDVLAVQRERIQLALAEDEPTFTPMGRDELVVERRYNAQQPKVVAQEITSAAEDLATSVEALDGPGWARTAVYAWPAPAVHTLEWVGRHTVHELIHHLLDIDRQRGETVSRI